MSDFRYPVQELFFKQVQKKQKYQIGLSFSTDIGGLLVHNIGGLVAVNHFPFSRSEISLA